MSFKIIEHIIQTHDAPELTEADLMRMQDAANYLGVSVYQLRNWLDQGRLKAVIDEEQLAPAGSPRRFVLRQEVEALKREREQQGWEAAPMRSRAERDSN